MEPAVRRFSSFEEADAADVDYYLALTPEQRIEVFLQLLEVRDLFSDGALERMERVARVSKLELR